MKKSIIINFFAAIMLVIDMHPIFANAQEWEVCLESERELYVSQVISVDEGMAALAMGLSQGPQGEWADSDGLLVKFLDDGSFIRKEVHIPGMELKYFCAQQVGDGNYLVFGACEDSTLNTGLSNHHDSWLCVDIMDQDLDLVSRHLYSMNDEPYLGFEGGFTWTTMRCVIEGDGHVLLATEVAQSHLNFRFMRFDQNGELVGMATQPLDQHGNSVSLVTSVPGTDQFLFFGKGGPYPGGHAGFHGAWYLNSDLSITGNQMLTSLACGEGDLNCKYIRASGYWHDGHLWLMGHFDRGNTTIDYDALVEVDTDMTVYRKKNLPKVDVQGTYCDAVGHLYVNDSTVFAVTTESRLADRDAVAYLLDRDWNILGMKVVHADSLNENACAPVAFRDGSMLLLANEQSGVHYSGEHFRRVTARKLRREDLLAVVPIGNGVSQEGIASFSSVYPNPVKDELCIAIPNGQGDCVVTVFAVTGATINKRTIRAEAGTVRVDVSGIASGIYAFSIVSNDRQVGTGRFVKE